MERSGGEGGRKRCVWIEAEMGRFMRGEKVTGVTLQRLFGLPQRRPPTNQEPSLGDAGARAG